MFDLLKNPAVLAGLAFAFFFVPGLQDFLSDFLSNFGIVFP